MSTPEVAPKPRRKPPSAGRGRRKGEINKVTRDVREMIAVVALKNAGKVDAWLARVAKKNPAKAIDLYCKLIEYHIPKLSRQEIVKPPSESRVIDSSQLTQEQREQLRQMILAQAEPAQLKQIQPNVLEPGGLGDSQVVESIDDRTSVTE